MYVWAAKTLIQKLSKWTEICRGKLHQRESWKLKLWEDSYKEYN